MKQLLVAAGFAVALSSADLRAVEAPRQEPAPAGSGAALDPSASLFAALEAQGVRLDLERGLLFVPCSIDKREELLEYLLVGPRGSAHESLLLTDVVPSLLNAAMLALGVEPGKNARWQMKDPPPTEEELRARVPPATLLHPEGDGFLPYLAWREGDELFLFRVEDLISNLDTRRSMTRHRWVYLGSRFVVPKRETAEVFAADREQNLINLAYFYEGNTLITAALPECERQTIWVGNSWLLPPSGSSVALLLARESLESAPSGLPAEWLREVPQLPARQVESDPSSR